MSLTKAIKRPLPYFTDSAQLFASVADRPWAVFLDSTYPSNRQGRYDIIAYAPVCTLQTFGGETVIVRDGIRTVSREDPFLLLKRVLGSPFATLDDLPFNGGAIGYFAYDLARRIEKLPKLSADVENTADMAIGVYRWCVIVDHQKRQTWLAGYDLDERYCDELLEQFGQLPATLSSRDFKVLARPQANMDSVEYALAFAKIKSYLREGDSYQVNLTQCFSSPCTGDPWIAYRELRKINPAPFSAYLNLPDAQILSSSPERFLKLAGNKVETRPIKGTRRRDTNPEVDSRLIAELAASEKDRAENVMIVDLLRNDLGKCCRKGSVCVPELFAVESYATVHHLVSTVKGELAPGQHAADLLRHCFPGGSITGAPKIRSMEIIEELEPQRRGVYCGAIGYIGFDGNMDTNIAIRTLVHNGGRIRFWAGGGIVSDSVLEEEYQECFDKAEALLRVLECFRA